MTVRIDSYVSPTSWDDLGMDWNNPKAQDARYIDALCRAIRERYKVFFGVDSSNVNLPQITPDRRLDYSKLLTIHNATRALIPKFLDITTPVTARTIEKTAAGAYYTGTYNYKYDTLKYGTLKECLASFGDSVFLSPQPHVMDNSAWLKQQYNILNALRYSHTVLTHFNAPVFIHGKTVSGGDPTETTFSVNPDGYASSRAFAQTYPTSQEYETMGFSNGKISVYAAMIPRAVKSYIARYAVVGLYDNRWGYCPSVYSEAPYPGYWNIAFETAIPAGATSFDFASMGDLALISTPPHSDIYKIADNGWKWGAGRAIDTLIMDNTFNFRNW